MCNYSAHVFLPMLFGVCASIILWSATQTQTSEVFGLMHAHRVMRTELCLVIDMFGFKSPQIVKSKLDCTITQRFVQKRGGGLASALPMSQPTWTEKAGSGKEPHL